MHFYDIIIRHFILRSVINMAKTYLEQLQESSSKSGCQIPEKITSQLSEKFSIYLEGKENNLPVFICYVSEKEKNKTLTSHCFNFRGSSWIIEVLSISNIMDYNSFIAYVKKQGSSKICSSKVEKKNGNSVACKEAKGKTINPDKKINKKVSTFSTFVG